MKYYMAPLEGVTTYVFRNAYHTHFQTMDKYFTPFIVPHKDKRFSTREQKELSREHNYGLYVVPQLLTNHAEDFLITANKIVEEFGYQEINLNLGCPSGTVVAKKKGSGFLAFPEELDRFLDGIFSKATFDISIKTRIGKEEHEEFERILEIYNKYPLKELIIHPRVQTDFYRNLPNWDVFEMACKNTSHPICYNGDIFTTENYHTFSKRFPTVECVMLGRGVVANPGLVNEISGKASVTNEQFRAFHDMIYEEYQRISSGERNTLFKMKELWSYWSKSFRECEKLLKKIKKAEQLKKYEQAVEEILETCSLIHTGDRYD